MPACGCFCVVAGVVETPPGCALRFTSLRRSDVVLPIGSSGCTLFFYYCTPHAPICRCVILIFLGVTETAHRVSGMHATQHVSCTPWATLQLINVVCVPFSLKCPPGFSGKPRVQNAS